ncbi:flotillin-like FloA family protein [Roseivirga pacifica]|uniref:flotillin-like FloA family protein n=1 Tax=Roseivirga pacifica TaxID=1267423 RepID=UPI003BB11795
MNEYLVNFLAIVGGITILYIVLNTLGLPSIISLSITASLSNNPIPFSQLLLMKIRKVDVRQVVSVYIALGKAEISVAVPDLEIAYLKGNNLTELAKLLIAAKAAEKPITVNEASEILSTSEK